MYEVKPYEPRIRLIGNDGTVVEYDSWEECISSLEWNFVNNQVVTKFNDPRDAITLDWYFEDLRKHLSRRTQYVIRDEFGSVFSRGEILNAIAENNYLKYHKKNSYFYNKFEFMYRKTPVPYTGKRRWRFKNFYRRPKTTQEKRLSYAYTNYIRGRRKPRSLPDSWEDIPRFNTKNWKKHRRTQYK